LNLLTANYGFFVYLALSLHVFLLDDSDIEKWTGRIRWPRPEPGVRVAQWLRRFRLPSWTRRYTAVASGALAVAWVMASAVTAFAHFGPSGEWSDRAARMMQNWRVYRVANAYHLFGHITRERVEAEFQTRRDGRWSAHDFHYKPGDPLRAPPFVAPHQPRVDFRLWFYGLDFRRGVPRYVVNLLARMCRDPDAVAGLFARPLPAQPEAVRIEFWRYHFTTPEEREATRAWWRRESLGSTPKVDCSSGGRD